MNGFRHPATVIASLALFVALGRRSRFRERPHLRM
jgi:hypothetical protein